MQNYALLSLLIVRMIAPQSPAGDWQLIKQADLILGDSRQVTVQLLKSSRQTGEGGALQQLFDVQLLVLHDGKVVFDFAQEHVGKSVARRDRFFMRDLLDLEDITLDGNREIIFRSGSQGASDFVSRIHVLRFDKGNGTFENISPIEFYESGTHGLRWLDAGNRRIAVVAKRGEWPASTPLHEQCHYCESFFVFDAYEWNPQTQSFSITQSVQGKSLHHDSDEAFEEWPYIIKYLNQP